MELEDRSMGLFGGLLGNASQKDIEKQKDNWRIF